MPCLERKFFRSLDDLKAIEGKLSMKHLSKSDLLPRKNFLNIRFQRDFKYIDIDASYDNFTCCPSMPLPIYLFIKSYLMRRTENAIHIEEAPENPSERHSTLHLRS